jgi:hypothetical protein
LHGQPDQFAVAVRVERAITAIVVAKNFFTASTSWCRVEVTLTLLLRSGPAI